jgi:hypothetical protein
MEMTISFNNGIDFGMAIARNRYKLGLFTQTLSVDLPDQQIIQAGIQNFGQCSLRRHSSTGLPNLTYGRSMQIRKADRISVGGCCL